MRTGLLIAVIICFLSNPSAGQPRLAAPNGAFSERLTLDRAYAEAPDTDRSSGRRFLRSFGGGLLGAGIGGGLGALIGPVAEEELYPECSRGIRDCEGEIHLGPIGVWLGGTVGALAGAQADMDGSAVGLAMAGGGFGSLIGLAALATASNGRGPWGLGGFVAGAAAGAAFGTTIAAYDSASRAVFSRNESGALNWRWPRPVVGRHPAGGMTVHVSVVHIRF